MSYFPLPPPVAPSASSSMRVYRLVYANTGFWFSIDVVAPDAERASVLGAAYARKAEKEELRECGSATPYRPHFASISPDDDGDMWEASEGVYLIGSGCNG